MTSLILFIKRDSGRQVNRMRFLLQGFKSVAMLLGLPLTCFSQEISAHLLDLQRLG